MANIWLGLWRVAWYGQTTGLLVAVGAVMFALKVSSGRDEDEVNRRRKPGGSYYRELAWKLKGKIQAEIATLTQLIANEDDRSKRRDLVDLLSTNQGQLEIANQMLDMHRGVEGDDALGLSAD